MRTLPRILLTPGLLLLSAQASALEMEFYTYDGFSEVVNAFKRLALVFGNNEYLVLFAVAAVLGIFFGALFWSAKALVGGGGSTLPLWLITVFFGVAIFKGLIMPKGTLHIYDPVRNAYEAVGGIPDVIVFVAGMTNKAERAMQRITDTGSAHPYAKEAGGLSFGLMFNATGTPLFAKDYYLKKTLETYYQQCSGQALARASSGLSYDSLRSTATDLLAEFAKMKHTMFFTQVYNDGAWKSGESMTCSDAFDNYIQPALTDATRFENFTKLTCLKTGFNVADLLQWSTCKTRLAESYVNLFGGTGGEAVFIRNLHLAEAITQSMLNINPEVGLKTLTNRNMMTQGLGAAVAANDWIPKIRASVLTLVLGIMPLLMLFVVTPLYAKALQLGGVLILWITIWGVIDIVAAQIILDQAYSAAAEIKEHAQGLVAFMTAPESAAQGLAVIGKARGMAAVIASVICAFLFKVSAAGFTSMASNWGGMASTEGARNAEKAFHPENHADTLRSLRQTKADSAVGGQYGAGYMDSMAVFNGFQQAAEANSSIANLASETGGFNPGLAGQVMGTGRGMETSGVTKGRLSLTPGSDPVSRIGDISNEMGVRQGKTEVGQYEGNSTADLLSGLTPEQRASTTTLNSAMRDTEQAMFSQDLVGAYRQHNPGMTEGQAWASLAKQGMARDVGEAQASGFDVERLMESKWVESRQEIAGAEAYERVRAQGANGQAWSDAEIAEGRQKGSLSSAIGTGRGIDEAGMGRAVDAQAVSQVETAAHGRAVREAAAADGESTVQRANEMATIAQGGASANRDALNLLAQKMGGTTEDVQLANALATGNNVMVSSEKVHDMVDRGMVALSAQQLAEIDKHGGGHAYVQFTPEGDFVGMNISGGNVVTSSNSTTVDESTSYQLATRFGESDGLALLNPDHRDTLRGIVRQIETERADWANADPTFENLITNLTQSSEHYIKSDLSKYETLEAGVSGNASAGIGGGGAPGASVGINAGASGTQRETDAYGINRQAFIENLNDARRAAHEQMFKDGYHDKTAPDYAERHSAIMADRFATYARTTVEDARKLAHQKAEGTDLYEANDREKRNPAITGQASRNRNRRY